MRRTTAATGGALAIATALALGSPALADQNQPASRASASSMATHAKPGHAKPGHPKPGHAKPAAAKRVVLVVVDGLSRQEINRYNMSNVKAMMRRGANFPRALVGHMGAVTVVTHNVLTTGVLPKHMGWTEDGYRDVDGVLKGFSEQPENPYWLTSEFTKDEMFAVQHHAGYPKLADYLHVARPGSTVATVSPKAYAGWGLGGSGSDMIVTFSGRNYDCDGAGKNWRGPDGVNVPAYLSKPECGRFYVNSSKTLTYDTDQSPARLYPLDGNRYTVGKDAAHQGSDVWATDAALSIMDHEKDWSGIFLTLPGIDKAAHMWGGVDDKGPRGTDGDAMTHMKNATAVADAQVGRVIRHLRSKKLLDETLVVLTADHGMLSGRHFRGVDDGSADRGYYNWYYGKAANGDYQKPSPALRPLIDTGNIAYSYQDSAIRSWLKDRSRAKVKATAKVMSRLPDVVAVYSRAGSHYRLESKVSRKKMGAKSYAWFKKHAQTLVDTSAAKYGADLIGLLADNTTYSVAGDHGGIQRTVQKIPIVFDGAGVGSRDPKGAIRSVDIMPTILDRMGITKTMRMDGKSYRLPSRRR